MKQIIEDPNIIVDPLKDGALIHTLDRRGRPYTKLRLGPNAVHAFIRRKNGDVEDLGISHNLLTNTGRDLWANAFGHATNASGALTSITAGPPIVLNGSGFAAADTWKGWRVFIPVTGVTTAPVYGNIGTNTTTTMSIDQYWTAADGTGTTPAGTNAFYVIPTCVPRFMALTTDTSGPVAGDTALTGEITTGGCARAKATFAHTVATSTYTMQTVYSVTASFTNIHKMALFTCLVAGMTLGSAGIPVFITNLNQDATVGNGDTLTVTDTITLSG